MTEIVKMIIMLRIFPCIEHKTTAIAFGVIQFYISNLIKTNLI